MTIETLLVELNRRDIKLFLAGGKLRLEAPVGALTPELKEAVRQNKTALLMKLREQPSFDSDQAQQLFADALARLNEAYPYGAIQWAQAHKPELWEACLEALERVQAAFRAKDMAAIRRATAEFEQANRKLFETYPGLPWRPGQPIRKGIER